MYAIRSYYELAILELDAYQLEGGQLAVFADELLGGDGELALAAFLVGGSYNFV